LTKASGAQGSDATVGIALLADEESTAAGAVEVLCDSAYGTGEALDALDRAGHTPMIKPWPLCPRRARRVHPRRLRRRRDRQHRHLPETGSPGRSAAPGR
jgi:hypothetical protein